MRTKKEELEQITNLLILLCIKKGVDHEKIAKAVGNYKRVERICKIMGLVF